jgi:hypothetical protein
MTEFIRLLPVFAGPFLIVALLLLPIFRHLRTRPFYLWALLGGSLLVLLLPVQGLPVAGYIRGLLGDLSIVTLLLLGNALWSGLVDRPGLDTASRSALLAAIGVIGALFYPLALGLTGFDPYQLGYGGLVLPAAILVLSLAAWFARRRALAVLLLLPVAAYDLRLLESHNLWDYLLDPWLVIYAWIWLLRGLFSRGYARIRYGRAEG